MRENEFINLVQKKINLYIRIVFFFVEKKKTMQSDGLKCQTHKSCEKEIIIASHNLQGKVYP